jgi:pimeloyl-ACP methyl ester carboxylesterase
MSRLGYDRYGAQGGDVGAVISPELGRVDPDHVAGVHVNAATIGFMPFPPLEESELAALSGAEQARVARTAEFLDDEFGYAQIQATRPQTLAYGLTDSPVGQLAWIVEKFKEWTDPAADLPEDAVDRDQLLTNVSVYWFTGTGASAAQFLYETAHAQDWPGPSDVPQGWAVFAANDDLVRRLVDPDGRIEHWSEFDRGGHFAAMEAPDLLVEDVRAFFRKLR